MMKMRDDGILSLHNYNYSTAPSTIVLTRLFYPLLPLTIQFLTSESWFYQKYVGQFLGVSLYQCTRYLEIFSCNLYVSVFRLDFCKESCRYQLGTMSGSVFTCLEKTSHHVDFIRTSCFSSIVVRILVDKNSESYEFSHLFSIRKDLIKSSIRFHKIRKYEK